MDNKELEQKIIALEQKLEEANKEISRVLNIAKNHEHTGQESKRIEDLIKRAKYVDGKAFRVGGTDGKTASYTDKNDKTITVTNGIIV